jgi:hypothetical protein
LIAFFDMLIIYFHYWSLSLFHITAAHFLSLIISLSAFIALLPLPIEFSPLRHYFLSPYYFHFSLLIFHIFIDFIFAIPRSITPLIFAISVSLLLMPPLAFHFHFRFSLRIAAILYCFLDSLSPSAIASRQLSRWLLPFRYRYADYAFIFSVYFASAAISSRR